MKELFKDLYKQYFKEYWKQSIIYSIIIGLASLLISLTCFILIAKRLFWISFIVFVNFCILSLLFQFRNKPTDKDFARDLDKLGLKERAITMLDYEENKSLLARIQRQNAIDNIKKINKNQLKIVIKPIIYIVTFILSASCVFLTTLSVLDAKEIIDISEIINIPEIINQYEINYDVSGEGYIDGDLFQVIEEGKDGEFVLAVEAEGYVFDSWSDGNTSPSRLEAVVTKDMYLIAKFVPLGDEGQDGEGEGEGSGQDGQPGDEDTSDRPGEEGEGQGDGQPQPGGQEGGGTYTPTNQVIDGETYYGDAVYQNAYDDAMSQMQEDSGMSDDSKEVISDYYANIKK